MSVSTWFVCPPKHQQRDVNLQKKGPTAVCRLPLQCLSQQKDEEEEEEESSTISVAYLSLDGEFLFYTLICL